MRLAWPPPWHLIAPVLISVIALVLVHLSPSSLQGTLSLLALILVFLIPGYLAVLSIFPGKSEITLQRRAFLCLASSVLLAGLFSLILTLTPRGLNGASLATILSLLAIFLTAVAYGRWSNLLRNRRFYLLPIRGLRSARAFSRISRATIKGRRTALAIVLLIGCFIAALGFGYAPYQILSSEPFTELEVDWPVEALGSPSSSIEDGKELFAKTRIINHEKRTMNYTLKLIFRNSTLFSRNLVVGQGESWQDQISFMLTGQATSPGPEALDLLLYKEGDLVSPCNKERLWVNLSRINSGQSSSQSQSEDSTSINSTRLNATDNSSIKINGTENNSSVILQDLEDKSKVTVLSVGGSGMGGGGSSGGTQTVAEKPAPQTAKQPKKPESSPSTDTSTVASEVQSDPVVAGKSVPILSVPSSKDNQTGKDNESLNDNLTLDQADMQEAKTTEKPAPLPSSAVAAKETQAAPAKSPASVPSVSQGLSSEASEPLIKSTEPSSPTVPDANANSNANSDADSSTGRVSAKATSLKASSSNESNLSLAIDQSDIELDRSQEQGNSNSNSPPRLVSLQANNSQPLQGSSVLWTAKASDAEGDRISYMFLVDDEEMTNWSLSNSWIWNTSSLSPGDYEISVYARDDKSISADPFGDVLIAAIALQPPLNQPPALKALVPDKASPLQQGAAIFWRAKATDQEGDKILYKFLLDGQEASKWSKINSWSWLTAGMPAGDYQITVLARDGKHASEDSFDSSMNASFTLSRPNQAPALQELKSDRASPQGRGNMITWTASATDPDNDTIYYRFMKNDEAVTDWSATNSWVWDTSSENPGEYKIAVLAKDDLHASKDSFDSSLDSTFALTSSNSPPQVKELKADRSSPQAKGGVITWTAIAVDPDGDEISYKFLANDKEVRGWSSSDSWVWDTSSAALGDYTVVVLARDAKHASEDSFDSSKDAVITIEASNQPPAILALVPDISSPQVQGATVIWKAEAKDPEDDRILYKFQLNGRDMNRWSESASWKWSSRDLAAGDYTIRVLTRDGKHASEDSFDNSMDAVFSLITEIDQQIDQLMKKRLDDASRDEDYQSSDIQVASGNGTKSNAILGKGNSTAGQEKTVTPRKLGA